jgi:hypothetical protein
MVGNFGLGNVFTLAEKEEHELSYHLDVINESNNSEVEATTK